MLITPVAGVILPGLPLVVLVTRTFIMVVGGAGVMRGRGMLMPIGKPHPLVWQGPALVVVIAPRVSLCGGWPRLPAGCRGVFSIAGAVVVLVAGVLVALTVAVVIVARRRPHVAMVVVAASATLSLAAAAGVVGVGGAYAGGGVAGVLLLQLGDGSQHGAVQPHGDPAVTLSRRHGHVTWRAGGARILLLLPLPSTLTIMPYGMW